MIDPPRIVDTEARTAAVVHLTIERDRMPEEFHGVIQELLAVLAEQHVDPAGPLFAHHLRRPTDVFDFEAGFPVRQPVQPAGRVKPGELPAAKVVRTVYHGGYEGLPGAWAAFEEQARPLVTAAGLERTATLWEIYLEGPESDPDPSHWRTELNVPLVEA